MWSKTKSLFLSRVLTIAMIGLLCLLLFFIPTIAEWYDAVSDSGGILGDRDVFIPMCVILYMGEAVAINAMKELLILLGNINKGEVFIERNTRCLRAISWMCMSGGILMTVLALWRDIFIFAGFFSVMFGLIMRVLKNVFEKAVEIKSENDFTI
jgi:hypothetical protein